VISSPRRRAVHTAELAGLHVDEITEDVAEWDYGDYEGITTEQIRETVSGWTVWSHPVPGGESAEDISRRADKVLERIREALAETDVILVGHGHFGRVLVARWIDEPASFGVRFALDPASITVLGDERGTPQIQHLNITPK
jgi:probable phosphoglycerate mutase